MATQKTITLYSFSELSKEVQAKLIKEYSNDESFLDFDFAERHILREIENEAEEMGIQNFEFKYSGFYSQGDGASFTGTLTKELVAEILEQASNAKDWAEVYSNKLDEVYVHRNSTMYVHHNSVEVDFFHDGDDAEISLEDWRQLMSYFTDWKDNLCQKFYNRLLENYEWITSDENIALLLEELGETFLCNGQILSSSVFDEEEEEEEDAFPHGSERYYYT